MSSSSGNKSRSVSKMANISAMHALISESVWSCMQVAISTSVNIAARKAQAGDSRGSEADSGGA